MARRHEYAGVHLTLETRDARQGNELLSDTEVPMVWSAEGDDDDETIKACFSLINHDGTVADECTISGDEWREIEDKGEKPYIWIWVRRGASLASAVSACFDACDPDGYDNDYEAAIEEYVDEVDQLRAVVKGLLDTRGHARQAELWDRAHQLWLDTTPYWDKNAALKLAQSRDPSIDSFEAAIAAYGTSLLAEIVTHPSN
jgi:hypothetical protein